MRIIVSLVAALLIGGCSFLQSIGNASVTPVGKTTVAQAQQAVVAVENGYGAALGLATIYGRLPDCSPTVTSACRSYPLMVKIDGYRAKVRAAIDLADKASTQITSDSTQFDALIVAARTALAEYQTVIPKPGAP